MKDYQTHLIFDIETLSTRPDGVILSIACVPFQFEVEKTFNEYVNMGHHVKLSVEDQLKNHRKIRQDVVDWWLGQSKEAREVTKPSKSDKLPRDALIALREYVSNTSYTEDSFVWSRGSTFDFPMIESLHDTYGMKIPYSTWSIRDLKTFFDVMTGGNKGAYKLSDVPRNFIQHNALHDVAMDALRCNDIYKTIMS